MFALLAVNITSMILACSFDMFPPKNNRLQGRRRIQVQSHRSRIGAKTCAGVTGDRGPVEWVVGGGCNVVMLLVASHSSKGGQYGKGQVPPISYSLGWMLQQVPLKPLSSFLNPVLWGKSILLSQWLETWWVLSWLSHFWSWHGNSTLAPFSGLPRQRLSFCYCRSSCVRHVVHALFLSSIAAKIPALVLDPVFQGRLLPTRTWNHGDWCRDTLRGTSAPLEEEHRWCPHCIVQQCRCPGSCEKHVSSWIELIESESSESGLHD